MPTAPENNKESARCTTGVKSMEEVEIVREEESVGGKKEDYKERLKADDNYLQRRPMPLIVQAAVRNFKINCRVAGQFCIVPCSWPCSFSSRVGMPLPALKFH